MGKLSPRIKDLTGKVFGKLTVLELDTIDERKFAWWICKCECGNIKSIRGSRLLAGTTTSCGCKRRVYRRFDRHYARNYNAYYLHNKDNTDTKIFESIVASQEKLYRSDSLMHVDMSNVEYVIGETVHGQKFIIDPDTLFIIADYYMCVDDINNQVYGNIDGKRTMLSRYLMQPADGMCVDHINGDPLDNRVSNLRVVTSSQNNMNRRIMKNNKTGIPGVSRYSDKLWCARIGINGKDKYLGYFNNKEDAIKARLDAEEKYYGKYSFRNSRKSDETPSQK